MNKELQKEFYKEAAREIRELMQSRSVSVSQLANTAGVQFNTVDAIVKGKPFYFHQAVWLLRCLGISIDGLLESTTQTLFKEKINDNQKEGCESFL